MRALAASPRAVPLGLPPVSSLTPAQCGMVTFTNDVLHAKLVSEFHTHAGDGIDFLAFPELEASVRDDVAFLRGHELILKESKIVGWVYQYVEERRGAARSWDCGVGWTGLTP